MLASSLLKEGSPRYYAWTFLILSSRMLVPSVTILAMTEAVTYPLELVSAWSQISLKAWGLNGRLSLSLVWLLKILES